MIAAFAVVCVVAVIGVLGPRSSAKPVREAGSSKSKPPTFRPKGGGAAPELTGISAWINSAPLTLSGLRGKVVVVDFWTFQCINCRNALPGIKGWYAKYHSKGLEIVGVHTPELESERNPANVRAAVKREGILYPVALDPKFATWSSYKNLYWPAWYVIDKKGIVRHVHEGEGDYDNTARVIEALLAEPA